MREEGLKNREIAEKLGISLTAVVYWIKKLGLEKRSSRFRVDWMRCGNRLIKLLEREAMETLGYSKYQIGHRKARAAVEKLGYKYKY